MSKTCVKCNRTLPIEQFGKGSKTADGLRSDCRDCANEAKRAWRKMVKEKGTKRAQLLSTIDPDGNPVGEWVTGETRGRGDCNVQGCDEPHFSMRLCRGHFRWARALGNLPPRPEMVECRDCGGIIIVSETGPVPVDCERCQQRKLRESHPDKRKRHRSRVLERYGLTHEDYESLLASQGGLCGVCGGLPDSGNNKQYGVFSIDHDHATGRVRGLLCAHCNFLLGHAKDSVKVLERAISYLKAAA